MLEGTLLGLLYFSIGAVGLLLLCGSGFAIHYYCCENRKLSANSHHSNYRIMENSEV